MTYETITEAVGVRLLIYCPHSQHTYMVLPGDTFNFTHSLNLKIPESWKKDFQGPLEFKKSAFQIKVELVSKKTEAWPAIKDRPLPESGSLVSFEKEIEIEVVERAVKPCCSQIPPEPEGGRIVDL